MLKRMGEARYRQRFFACGVVAIALLSAGCTTAPKPISSETTEPRVSESTVTTSPSEHLPTTSEAKSSLGSAPNSSRVAMAPGQNIYQSDRFGFSFTYPDGFELEVTHLDDSPEEYVTLLRLEDVGDPEPPFVGISVYENPQDLSLEGFREQRGYFILNEFPDVQVAGQRTLDFEAAGLYESREHLFKTPEGAHVVSLSATYLDTMSETDPLWLVAQQLRDSFEWRSPSVTETLSTAVQVEPFTLDEMFDQGALGCGMSLLQPNAAGGEGFLFTHGIDNTPALMRLDGQWVRLNRTEASGEEFYGQQTSQTFVSEDGTVTVQIDVSLGKAGEIESWWTDKT